MDEPSLSRQPETPPAAKLSCHFSALPSFPRPYALQQIMCYKQIAIPSQTFSNFWLKGMKALAAEWETALLLRYQNKNSRGSRTNFSLWGCQILYRDLWLAAFCNETLDVYFLYDENTHFILRMPIRESKSMFRVHSTFWDYTICMDKSFRGFIDNL